MLYTYCKALPKHIDVLNFFKQQAIETAEAMTLVLAIWKARQFLRPAPWPSISSLGNGQPQNTTLFSLPLWFNRFKVPEQLSETVQRAAQQQK